MNPYSCNRKIGGGPAKRRNFANTFSHTFIYTTNSNGSLKDTYSWGNSSNPKGWTKNADEDRSAAKEAIDKGYGKEEGDPSLDKHVEDAFKDLDKPENEHRNLGVARNCKAEAQKLLKKAREKRGNEKKNSACP